MEIISGVPFAHSKEIINSLTPKTLVAAAALVNYNFNTSLDHSRARLKWGKLSSFDTHTHTHWFEYSYKFKREINNAVINRWTMKDFMRIVEAKQSRFKLIYIRFKRFTFVNQDRSSRQSSSVCKTRYIAIVRARIKTEWINQRRPLPHSTWNDEWKYRISDICPPEKSRHGVKWTIFAEMADGRNTRRYL